MLHILSHNLVRFVVFVIITVSFIRDALGVEETIVFSSLLQNIPSCSSEGKADVCVLQNNCSAATNVTRDCVFSIYTNSISKNYSADVHRVSPEITYVPNKPTTVETWVSGILSAVAISFSGIVGYLLSPIITSSYQRTILNILIGLAYSSLTSTAILQLIPEAYHLSLYVPDYLHIAVFTILATWFLYLFQTCASILFDNAKLEGSLKHEHHFHAIKDVSHHHHKKGVKMSSGANTPMVPKSEDCIQNGGESNNALPKANNSVTYDSHKLYTVSDVKDEENASSPSENKLTTLAWLIVLGDGLHNFIDGVSVGASYTQNLATGFTLTLAIACEEYPHELGDFAILLQSGLSVKKAATYNYMSALAIIVGVIVGIILGELKFSPHIFSSSAGLFLFISLSHLMPELKDMIRESLSEGKKAAWFTLLCQSFGFTVGFVVVFLITSSNGV